MTLLGSWRCSTEEHHPRMQSAWAFVLFQHAEESPNTETRWRKMPRGKRGLLLSIVEGALLRQLDHFRYDWLKQVAIILLYSNWPWLVRSWSGLQFSIFRPCLWAADCGGLGLAWYSHTYSHPSLSWVLEIVLCSWLFQKLPAQSQGTSERSQSSLLWHLSGPLNSISSASHTAYMSITKEWGRHNNSARNKRNSSLSRKQCSLS